MMRIRAVRKKESKPHGNGDVIVMERKERDPLTGRMSSPNSNSQEVVYQPNPQQPSPRPERELSLSSTLNARLKAAARKVNKGCLEFDPLEELAMMAMGDPTITNGQRINCLHIVASFLYPKQKSIEYRDTDFEAIQVDVTVFDPSNMTIREDIGGASERWRDEDFGDAEDD